MRTLPPITLTTGNPIPIEIGNDAAGVLIANESSFSIQVNIGAVIAWLPAWTIDYYDLSDLVTIGTATLSAQMLTSASNAPSSVALVSILAKNDKITGTYPCALARQTNIGNGVVTTSTTNTLQNDGSAPNTQIIETTPNDEVTSAFVLDNEGNLTLRTKDAGVWSIIMSIIAGSGGGAATKLFHGTSDNVPATGITSGLASTGVEVGTDSTHKFSMHDLGGYTSANGISISANMLTNGHVYTYAVSFVTGTCDHTIVTTTSIAASGWKNYPITSKWNGSAWVEIGGPGLRKWNGSAWAPINGGVFKWNGSSWVHL